MSLWQSHDLGLGSLFGICFTQTNSTSNLCAVWVFLKRKYKFSVNERRQSFLPWPGTELGCFRGLSTLPDSPDYSNGLWSWRPGCFSRLLVCGNGASGRGMSGGAWSGEGPGGIAAEGQAWENTRPWLPAPTPEGCPQPLLSLSSARASPKQCSLATTGEACWCGTWLSSTLRE